MITERQEELAALYTLSLLEGEERRDFVAEVAGNAELAALVKSLAAAAAELALTSPQRNLPAGLQEKIMAALPAQAAAKDDERSFGWFAPWAIAASLALAGGWLIFQNISLRRENTALDAEQQLAEVAYQTARSQLSERSLLAEKMINDLGARLSRSEDLARLRVAALVSLAGNTKEAQAIAVWDPDQQAGLLTFDKLPVIADNQDYQIWVVDPAYPNPVNGGVFHVAKDGSVTLAFRPDQPVRQANAFAISLEKKGGVPKAEGPIVMLGKLPAI